MYARLRETACYGPFTLRALRLVQMHRTVSVEGDEKRMFATGTDGVREEIAVVYFRCGCVWRGTVWRRFVTPRPRRVCRGSYLPTDYPTDAEWSARTSIEVSRAIKCPNIGYHIMTLKKIQQVGGARAWRGAAEIT